VAGLIDELGDTYPCRAEVFYWKSGFVPVPQIMGRMDMKLVTLSKYKIASATRHALPLIPGDPVSQQLGLKRAVLAAEFPVAGGTKPLMALNTHLSAFAQGTDTLDRQVQLVKGLLDDYNGDGRPWLIAGDFNMLPPGIDPNALDELSRVYYNPRTEIAPLFDAFSVAPSLAQATGPDRARYYTHIANHNKATIGADRTIDYYFYGGLTLGDFRVRTADTGHISDHLPMIADFNL
jgi:endonuclease/exonuclease/phosphatase family metal-dependent hydrolase